MRYEIKINEVRNPESKIKAYAAVTFEGSFKITDVALVENREGRLFVSMPSYKSNERTEQNEPVYKDYFNPITNDFYEELSEAIINAYENFVDTGEREFLIGEEVGELPFTVSVFPCRTDRGNIKGYGRIYLDNCFVIQNVSILDGKKGIFAKMPSVKIGTLANGKGKYRDVCYPVTADFKNELNEVLVAAYHETLAKRQEEAREQSQTISARDVRKQETPLR
ncbi:MAG: septation protein spoVG [Lachnospiraceae bacterium]|nr:septation protein spoVG [Lachnospiraceae bacterium]